VAGTTAQLTATTKDAQGNTLTGRAVTWTSTAEAVATVSNTGLVTAVTPGTSQIRATSESTVGQTTVTVTPVPVATVTLSAAEATLVATQQFPLTATAKDAQGNTLAGRIVTWGSNAEGVATVSQTGVVTAVANGTATITATSETKTAQAVITVATGTVIGAAGGVVTGPGGNVTITIPAGALSSGTAITVGAVAQPQAHARLIAGTAYDLGPDGTAFAQPVTLAIKFDPAVIGLGIPPNFRIHRFTSGAWTPLPGGSVDIPARTVTAPTSSFSRYAILEIPTEPLIFSSISSGAFHTCGVATGGAAYCWGSGSTGQLGHGSTASSPVPTLVSGGLTFSQVSAGGSHTCGITTAGKGYCWGLGTSGRLGNGQTTTSTAPVPVSSVHNFQSISAGSSHTCAVTTAGAGYCWGLGGEGQFGDGSTALLGSSAVPVAVTGGHTFTLVAAGGAHTCALTTAGAAYCWGGRGQGRLGNDNSGSAQDFFSPVPVAVSDGHIFTSIAAASVHSCGAKADGSAWCWGDGTFGRLGNNALDHQAKPVRVSGPALFSSIVAGGSHTCGVTTAQLALCWGFNNQGQGGNGGTVNSAIPAGVVGALTFTKVSAGGNHTCAVASNGKAWCWGDGAFGTLGYGGFDDSAVPLAVSGPTLPAGALRP
ncbi:MAG: hypothetical protein HOP28_08900, partial [Gemmatimonadales bacterium]|nr:hypothetical protein [Gemmatimonadales bacterium]